MQYQRPNRAALLALLILNGCASVLGDGTAPRAPDAAVLPPSDTAARAPVLTQHVRAAHPEELMGKDPQTLRSLMGAPTLLRKDHGAEVWQYAGKSCVLFVYLYPNKAGALDVSYLDARSKTSGAAVVQDCLTSLGRGGSETISQSGAR